MRVLDIEQLRAPGLVQSGRPPSEELPMNLTEALQRITPTPVKYQVWTDWVTAKKVLRCTADELDALRRAGLATSGELVEQYDVWNTGFLEGVQRSRGEREMIFFNRLLRSNGSDWVSGFKYAVFAVSECTEGALCSSADWAIPSTSEVRWTTVNRQPGRAEWRGTLVMHGLGAAVVSRTVRTVWDQFMATYGFQFTSIALAADVAQTRFRRRGDCTALSRVLVEDLQEAGYTADLRAGYIFGGERTRWHRWVRVLDDDGSYKHLDPAMAMLADRFFTPEYKAFCFGSRLNRIIRLDDEEQFYVRHQCGTQERKIFVTVRLRSA